METILIIVVAAAVLSTVFYYGGWLLGKKWWLLAIIPLIGMVFSMTLLSIASGPSECDGPGYHNDLCGLGQGLALIGGLFGIGISAVMAAVGLLLAYRGSTKDERAQKNDWLKQNKRYEKMERAGKLNKPVAWNMNDDPAQSKQSDDKES